MARAHAHPQVDTETRAKGKLRIHQLLSPLPAAHPGAHKRCSTRKHYPHSETPPPAPSSPATRSPSRDSEESPQPHTHLPSQRFGRSCWSFLPLCLSLVPGVQPANATSIQSPRSVPAIPNRPNSARSATRPALHASPAIPKPGRPSCEPPSKPSESTFSTKRHDS